jgi:phosphate transport system protein
MNKMTEGHTVKRFDKELTNLHQLVLDIGHLVIDQLHRAVKTLEEEDVNTAREVISRDEKVNEMDIRADEEIVHLIAHRQPMARDLREVLTVSKIVCDLERVGDEARKIARLTITCYGNDNSPPNAHILRDIVTMAEFAGDMVARSMEAFDELDLDKAIDVIRTDLDLEEEFRSSLRRLSTFIMEDARSVGHVVDVVLGLRALERIGGHAKNVAGHVVFLAKGRDVRHETIEEIEQEQLTE